VQPPFLNAQALCQIDVDESIGRCCWSELKSQATDWHVVGEKAPPTLLFTSPSPLAMLYPKPAKGCAILGPINK
jgi:hypothetical protein